MDYRRRLALDNINYLDQLAELLLKMSDEDYKTDSHGVYSSSVGKQVRHVLDHYIAFTVMNKALINYDHRNRESDIELNRATALAKIEDLKKEISNSEEVFSKLKSPLKVLCNASDDKQFTLSTPERELQFLISHTIHHFAIIAMILDARGFILPDTFGVAPSTLKYNESNALNTSA